MKTTKDDIDLLRHHANVVANRDQGALILSVLDDLDEAEARAERYREVIVDAAALVDTLNANIQGGNRGSVRDPLTYAVVEDFRKRCDAALAETANETSEANVAATAPSDAGQPNLANLASPEIATSATREPGTVSEEPGTSSPDEAERAAREWWDANGESCECDAVHTHMTSPGLDALATLIRAERAQAREAGRVEGWNEAVEACARHLQTEHPHHGGPQDAIELCTLKRPDRAKGEKP